MSQPFPTEYANSVLRNLEIQGMIQYANSVLRNLEIQGMIPNPFCCSTIAGMKDGCVQAAILDDQPGWVSVEYKHKMEIIREVHFCPFCGTPLPGFQKKAEEPDFDLPLITGWEVQDAPHLAFVGAYIGGGKDDLLLSVSRKTDPNSKGLPGGKVEPGETHFETLVREVKEETGLVVKEAFPFFDAKDDTGIRGITFFVTEYEGKIYTKEAGVVEWVTHKDIVEKTAFPGYNRAMMDRLDLTHLLV